jgi:hypothetical protein
LIAACSSAIERKVPRLSRRRVSAEKKVSTALSQEPEVVEDDVEDFAGRHLPLDRVQEAEELLVAVARHAAADHRAVEHVERREQGGGAVALVDRHRILTRIGVRP